MRQYELMVILDPDLEETAVPATLDKFLTVITAAGGVIDNVEHWGKRKMAYEIKKKSQAYYAVVNLTSTPADAQELDRQLGLSETTLRTKSQRVGDRHR